MRNISPAGLAKIANRYGNEPIAILEVDWGLGSPRSYADRDIPGDPGVPGRIIEIGNLDNVVGVSNNSASQSIDVTLDDTDGTIKAIFNACDVHKRTARLFQWFEGLALADKFLIFAGKLSTPIVWNEHDRTVKFTVISQLEDREVGFSAEEGQFPCLPSDLVGKEWPMIFGTVQDCPALQINHAVNGTTLAGVGIISGAGLYAQSPIYDTGSNVDEGFAVACAQAGAQLSVLWSALACWSQAGDRARAASILDQINAIESQLGQQAAQQSAQRACAAQQRQAQISAAQQGLGANPVRILGGEDFPQNQTITLDIGGGQFTGAFQGQYFYITSRYDPAGAYNAAVAAAEQSKACAGGSGGGGQFDYRMDVPCGCGDMGDPCQVRNHGFIVSTGGGTNATAAGGSTMQQFWADAGSAVKIVNGEALTYIVSITPGHVLAVKAYKQFVGEKRLIDVPSDLYRVEVKNYGTVTAVQIVFPHALSTLLGGPVIDPNVTYTEVAQGTPTPTNVNQGWTDDVYVTFEATAPEYGPNIVDILKHLITRYTDLTYDAESFTTVHAKLEKFPANFPILDRKNTLSVLYEIAYQARCALWIADGVFYIKYLPEEPVADDTLTVSDLDAEKGVEVELTETENLVTKMTITWRTSWAPGPTDRPKDKSEKLMVLRHNVTRYGTINEDYSWYIYNQPDIIYKCATFWLIRKSHTWKRVKFSTYLQKLNLETFDTVNLDFPQDYVASGASKAIVEKANYNSADNLIDFECLVPVRSGDMVQYRYYWPANLEATVSWPPIEDYTTNNAGGGGIGMGASGELPIGDTTGIGDSPVIWVGGPNVVYHAQSDHGDVRPSDNGFEAQPILNTSVYAELDSRGRPYVNLRNYAIKPLGKFDLPPLKSGISIDLRTTVVTDSWHPEGRTTRLGTFLYGIDENGKLQLDLGTRLADSDHPDTSAHFDDILRISEDSENLTLRLEGHVTTNDDLSGKGRLTDVLTTAGNGRLAVLVGASVVSEQGADYKTKFEDVLVPHEGNLCIDAGAYIHGDGNDAAFDFKFDGESGKYGAGTAFLKD